MDKLEKGCHHMIQDLFTYISQNSSVNLDELNTLSNAFFERKERLVCKGVLKNSIPCRHRAVIGEEFCLKHTPRDIPDKQPLILIQCQGINFNGRRCKRDAKEGSSLCGTHINQDMRNKREEQPLPCIFWTENEEDTIFCGKNAIYSKWCCKSHDHLHQNYVSMFKQPSLRNCLNATHSSHIIEQIKSEYDLIKKTQ